MSHNVSVVINYSKPEIFSDYADRDGYIQLTRSAGRVYLTVDGRDVGSMPAEEFNTATAKLSAEAISDDELARQVAGVKRELRKR